MVSGLEFRTQVRVKGSGYVGEIGFEFWLFRFWGSGLSMAELLQAWGFGFRVPDGFRFKA